jgi:hypothetical protein
MLLMFLFAIWNGANYYFYVFGKAYEKAFVSLLKEHEKELVDAGVDVGKLDEESTAQNLSLCSKAD